MVERIFQDIPDGKLAEADSQPFLISLGWSKGATWNDLLQSKRVLLISEAGAGKTYECRTQVKHLRDKGEYAFFVELASLSLNDLRSSLDYDEEKDLDAWLSSQSDIATFFLDSIDELKLSRGSFELALKRLQKGIGNQLHRVRIVITTRPIPFDEQLVRRILPVPAAPEAESKEEIFAKTAMNDHRTSQIENKKNKEVSDWRTSALMPLSDEQIVEFVTGQGIDNPTDLMDDLRKRNAQEFARRPQDLIELCADWREYKRIRTHHDQVGSNVRIKLQARDDRPEPAELSVDKAVDGASRLALAMLVTRRWTIRHNAASDDIEQEAALNPAIILSDWNPDEPKALLERPLFGFASYGRVRFHHRSVWEYLAAERLKTLLRAHKITFRALKRLLFAQTKGKTIVRPSMRPVAGWLALSENTIFEMLRDNEPAVLLDEGDPESLTPTQRIQALRAYVERYGVGGWRGLRVPHIQVHRFAFPELAEEITRCWKIGVENPEVREMLLALIEAGGIANCVEIAREVARNRNASYTERMNALDALISLSDPSLKDISAEIAHDEQQWPDSIARGAISRLFPNHISIQQLCWVLGRLEEKKHNIGDLSWQLSYLIADAKLDKPSLVEFRDELVRLVSDGLHWDEEWKPFSCDRPHLSGALAAICLRGLSLETSSAWLSASVLALRLQDREYGSDEVHQELHSRLRDLTAEDNERLFWAENSLLQVLQGTDDPKKRFVEIIRYGGIVELRVERDLTWIKDALGDTTRPYNDRALVLEIALRLSHGQEKWRSHLSTLNALVRDQPTLLAVIGEWLQPPKHNTENLHWEKEQAKRKEQRVRKEAKNRASWIQFQREIAGHPERVFSPERSWNTAWDLWRVMGHDKEGSKTSGWNRRFIEKQFGKQTADRLRLTLIDIWRKENPTLPSERPENERNTYLIRWRLGLAAIYAEAEDPQWAIKLSEKEAELAARYVAMGFNGLPHWVEQLVIAHENVVDRILGQELSWELSQGFEGQAYSMLLQDICHASEAVAKVFLPRLRRWLDSQENTSDDETALKNIASRMRKVIDVLMKYGDEEMLAHVRTLAQQHLNNDLPRELVFVWLPILIKLSPDLGIAALEERLQSVEPAKRSEAVTWFSVLFGDRHEPISLSGAAFTPQLLLRLLRLAYFHVRYNDDTEHEGSYTPDTRDHAERAREYILNTLLGLKGENGWAAKLEMAADPLFAHFKDRILAIAEENWAQEIDSEVLDEMQAVALDRAGEAPPSTNSAMFAILNDRLSDLDDLLLSDISPREAWAGITEERVMRREIARELKHVANNLYTVDQESVTADEKETDIRLRSTASNHEAIIELKLADGRYGRDLRDTIYDQLVKKYMAAEASRSGCLLITLAKDRQWDHPDNGQRIGLIELEALLRAEAKRVEEAMGGSVALVVHILDLRSRLSKEK
ncbi:MAG: hypothetical protein PHE17_02605 [Thiothrix sp.]|uniref:hypothetical protein n=1 Tax=Thiothrix sp. TaxID=1032 RepID=UPI0026126049|nr:hypothetical protein [Thiothrix sp.]MDD5391891.1 hypothetical protein [Thiothrix sp.]